MNIEKRDFDKDAATWDEVPGQIRMANNNSHIYTVGFGPLPYLSLPVRKELNKRSYLQMTGIAGERGADR